MAEQAETGEQDTAPTGFTEDQVKEMIAKATEEATSGLKAKNDELLGELKGFKSKAKEAEEQARKAAEDAARKSGNLEDVEKAWQDKLAAREGELTAELEKLTGTVQSMTVGAAAKDIAAELAVQGSAKVLERIARDRLAVEMGEDGPRVRVLDAAGKTSALSLDELKNELRGDPALKPIIAATKASGGGAAGANGRADQKTMTRKEFDGLDHYSRAEFSKSGGKVTDD